MSATTMGCVSCGATKAYPDGFPNRHFAECWQCAWNAHIRDAHPEVGRRIRRAARKRARRLTERDLRAVMTADELAQTAAPSAHPTHAPDRATNEETLP